MYVHILYISRVDFYLDDIQLMILFYTWSPTESINFFGSLHFYHLSNEQKGQNQASFHCFSIWCLSVLCMNQVPVDCYLYTERTKKKYSYALIVQKMKWLFGHKIDLLGISIGMELGSDQNCFGTIKVNLKTNILFVSIYTFENIRSPEKIDKIKYYSYFVFN
jgi:hypothetical protein